MFSWEKEDSQHMAAAVDSTRRPPTTLVPCQTPGIDAASEHFFLFDLPSVFLESLPALFFLNPRQSRGRNSFSAIPLSNRLPHADVESSTMYILLERLRLPFSIIPTSRKRLCPTNCLYIRQDYDSHPRAFIGNLSHCSIRSRRKQKKKNEMKNIVSESSFICSTTQNTARKRELFSSLSPNSVIQHNIVRGRS